MYVLLKKINVKDANYLLNWLWKNGWLSRLIWFWKCWLFFMTLSRLQLYIRNWVFFLLLLLKGAEEVRTDLVYSLIRFLSPLKLVCNWVKDFIKCQCVGTMYNKQKKITMACIHIYYIRYVLMYLHMPRYVLYNYSIWSRYVVKVLYWYDTHRYLPIHT